MTGSKCVVVVDPEKVDHSAHSYTEAIGVTLKRYTEIAREVVGMAYRYERVSRVIVEILCKPDWGWAEKAVALVLLGHILEQVRSEEEDGEEGGEE